MQYWASPQTRWGSECTPASARLPTTPSSRRTAQDQGRRLQNLEFKTRSDGRGLDLHEACLNRSSARSGPDNVSTVRLLGSSGKSAASRRPLAFRRLLAVPVHVAGDSHDLAHLLAQALPYGVTDAQARVERGQRGVPAAAASRTRARSSTDWGRRSN
jgi:hypothetical protein